MAVVIVGAGHLGREVLAALHAGGRSAVAFLVEPGYQTAPVNGVPVSDDLAVALSEPGNTFLVAVGGGRDRSRLVDKLGEGRFATVVHPGVTFGPNIELGEGAMILGPVNATTDITIGPHSLVYPGCILTHDCRLGAFVSLGPGVTLAGRVTIEEGATLGAGAVVTPNCRIGAWAVVGAGAVVIGDVQPGATVVGVPARALKARFPD